jgi:hypothetical protein
MRCSDLSDKEWVALKEAGKSAGKSIHSLRLLIQRGRMEKMRRQRVGGNGYGEIHEEAPDVRSTEGAGIMRPSQVSSSPFPETLSVPSQMISLPVEYFEQQQKERESLAQGLMMYRYKFELAEKELRLLPAPAESVTSKIRALEETVAADVAYREQLIETLQEQEEQIMGLEAELQQAQLPWWKKIWGR